MPIRIKSQFFTSLALACYFYSNLYANVNNVNTDFSVDDAIHQEFILKSYLLPKKHPLQKDLKDIFYKPSMFRSPKQFEKAGFKVKGGKKMTRSGHMKIMVGSHRLTPHFLFKKFPNSYSQNLQLTNYITRIKGAEIIREYIKEHHFKHLVVPHKWLYKLPDIFSKNGEDSYILIVEKMNIYDDWDDPEGKARKLYYNMDQEVLTELCILLHAVGGCDGYPRNQPFTRSGKIAFIDTEHIGRNKGHFIKHIVPALNEELQAYAIDLWTKLEEGVKIE